MDKCSIWDKQRTDIPRDCFRSQKVENKLMVSQSTLFVTID